MITIVIPVHNRLSFTRQCLQCLAAQTYPNVRVVVVDDGSTDGTGAMIAAEFPEVVVLRGDGNLWWTEATNWGVRYALQHRTPDETDFVLTLNDDTRVGPDYLQTLVDTYLRHKPCLVGSVSVDSSDPERLAYAGTLLEMYTAGGRDLAADYGHSYRALMAKTAAVESDSLPGRGTLIPLEVFDTVGLYDSKHYIHYMSDIEFSVRARKAGYQLVVSVPSVVQEYVEATSSLITHKATWREFWQGLTSFKSPTHLKIRYRFAIDHTKTKHLYFLCDLSRICAGFLLRKVGAM
jgi:GT2 family glycosyltransferase